MNGSPPLPAVDGGSGVTVTITVNDKTQIIGTHPSLSERTSKAHVPDAIPGTSNSMVVLKKVEKKESSETNYPGTSFDANNLYDTVSDAHSDRGSHSTSMSSSPGEVLYLLTLYK